MAPTPRPGGTDVHLPGPADVDPNKGWDFIESIPSQVWVIVGGLIVVLVAKKIFESLPWKVLGPVAIALIVIIMLAK